jgi:hypothetical protein
LVQHPRTYTPASRKLCLQRGLAPAHSPFHRLFQQDPGQAVQMDLCGPSPCLLDYG